MLIQFTIQNFLSFRDEVTFSMVGVNSDNQHIDHLALDAAGEGRSILPIAAIYGANAAGKSNLVKAMIFVRSLVVEGTRSEETIPVSTFKLGNYSKQPSKFEIIFTHQDTQYSYGFRLNREQIIEEWLYVILPNQKKEVMYFERATSTSTLKETTVKYGSKFKTGGAKHKQRLDFVVEGTRYNQLFLTEAVDRNVQSLIPIVDWFKKVLMIVPAESDAIDLEYVLHNSRSLTGFLSQFLQLAGTGIDSVTTEKIKFNAEYHVPNTSKAIRDDILQRLEELDKSSITMFPNPDGGRFSLSKNDENQAVLTKLITRHISEDGTPVDFSLEEESEGTQRLITLIPSLFLLKQTFEKVIFLDELDRRLHPLLSRYFVETAINCRAKGNQLIFTTHDTNLLDLDLLRRDEIWFIEKDPQGVSSCYSLAEFKIRPDLKIEKGYLNARFGAIPFFGDVQSLGWIDRDPKLSKANPEKQ
jgi:uncharacterized protein